MGSRVKPRGFEVTMNVGNGRGDLGRQWHRAVRREPIDVVHPEPNAFHVERDNRPPEVLGLVR